MLRQTFQQMARAIEIKPLEALEASRGHILIHALDVADGHDIGHVRDFANGQDDNDYALAVMPMLRLFAPVEDVQRVRDALSDIFNEGVEAAWRAWAPEDPQAPVFDERAGLRQFMKCEGRVRAPYRQQALGWE
jgi:hypothetical protein